MSLRYRACLLPSKAVEQADTLKRQPAGTLEEDF